MVEPEPEKQERPRDAKRTKTVSVDLAGPPIVESKPGRNLTLARICGRLHDGTRTLGQLTDDLNAVNRARCQPALPLREIEKIARSIYERKPCNPAPQPTPWVKTAVEYLASVEREIKGMGGSTGWAIYSALLECARRYGRQHERGVSVSVDRRTLAQLAGTNNGTVTRWIHRTNLVSVARRGSGRRSALLVLHVPEEFSEETDEGHKLHHLSPPFFSKDAERSRSDATNALHRTLYRLRWSGGSSKARPGLAKGTRKVRQSRPSIYAWDAIKRVGKSKGAILWAVVECERSGAGEMSRSELAARLGRKAASLREPLRFLVEIGLLIRVRRGFYAAPEDLARRLEDVRELGREPEQDREQIANHARQRTAYRNRNKRQKSEPSTESVENIRRSREKRAEHLRAQAERERQERQTPEEERERRGRVERLVRQGMSRKWVEAEVAGLDLEGVAL
jgi:hypothetical protein